MRWLQADYVADRMTMHGEELAGAHAQIRRWALEPRCLPLGGNAESALGGTQRY